MYASPHEIGTALEDSTRRLKRLDYTILLNRIPYKEQGPRTHHTGNPVSEKTSKRQLVNKLLLIRQTLGHSPARLGRCRSEPGANDHRPGEQQEQEKVVGLLPQEGAEDKEYRDQEHPRDQ